MTNTKSMLNQILPWNGVLRPLSLKNRAKKVKISDEALEAAVHLSSRYITKRFLPDKAIDLMDEAAARLRIVKAGKNVKLLDLNKELSEIAKKQEQALLDEKFEEAAKLRNQALETKEKIAKIEEAKRKKDEKKEYAGIVSAEDVATVVSEWTGVPVTQLTKTESERLINLEKILHKRVVGQDEAIKAVSKAIRRARSGACQGFGRSNVWFGRRHDQNRYERIYGEIFNQSFDRGSSGIRRVR